MPKQKLRLSQMRTIGAKTVAILVVPNGWIKNSSTRIPQDVPTMVELLMSAFTISRLAEIRKVERIGSTLTLEWHPGRIEQASKLHLWL